MNPTPHALPATPQDFSLDAAVFKRALTQALSLSGIK